MQFPVKIIGKGFLIVHDLSEDERTSVITGRPWKLGDNPITMRSWTPEFSVKKESRNLVSAIEVTIKFLLIKFHTLKILIALGNKLGKTVALDARKSSLASHVCLCFEVNLSKKLLTPI